ncbi:MAG: hypothetical protein WHT63_07095 [Tepidiforma sp.]
MKNEAPGLAERLRRALVIAAVAAAVYVPGAVTLWMLLAGRA